MRYLSLFSGIEAATQAWHSLGWEPVAFSEIEPFPSAVLKHHYPTIPNLGDVSKVMQADIDQLGHIDLVVGGSPCFVAGTLILIEGDTKAIEEIKVGDKVLTHKNRYQKVLRTGGDVKPTILVEASCIIPTRTTYNHPYYVRSGRDDGSLSAPYWKEAGALTPNDLIGLPLASSNNRQEVLTILCAMAGDEDIVVLNDIAWIHVTSVTETGDTEQVFNIEVAEDNSYTANNAIVHNCQAFSVAGLRKGLEDPRGNLTLEFLRIVSIADPEWVVWENVPGVLSEKTGALQALMNGLAELGYIIDLVERDAQWLGVPQRRRRIFLVCHKQEGNTVHPDLHDLTMAETFAKSALLLLADHLEDQKLMTKSSVLSGLNLDGYRMMVSHLDEQFTVPWTQPLRQWLAKQLGELSSDIEETVDNIIYFFDRASDEAAHVPLSIADTLLIANLFALVGLRLSPLNKNDSHLALFAEESLFYTAIEEYERYAKKCTQKTFIEKRVDTDLDRLSALSQDTYLSLSNLGNWARAASLHVESESLLGDFEESRQAQQDLARIPQAVAASGGGQAGHVAYKETGFADYEEGCGTLRAEGGTVGGGSETIVAFDKQSYDAFGNGEKASTVSARDFKGPTDLICVHAAQDPITDNEKSFALGAASHQAICIPINDKATRYKGGGDTRNGDGSGNGLGVGKDGDPSPTLTAGDKHAVAIQGSMIGRADTAGPQGNGFNENVCFTLNTSDRHAVVYKDGKPVMATAVRRLTPVECERLQGFPDNFTKIPHRGKEAENCPDSPRYKAIGNSMAVPVMALIGRMIDNKKL